MTNNNNISRKSIKELGWRQGSILPPALVTAISADCNPDEEVYIVASHDCDVTSANFESEPLAELLKVKLLVDKEGDGALFYGKNPRRIQFELLIEGKGRIAEANAHDRFFVQREPLLDFEPDGERTCSPLATAQFSDWLSRRYVRSAFPDAFNDRIRPVQRHLKKALSSQGQDITGLFAAMESWDELGDDEPYRFTIIATMTEDDYNDAQKRLRAQKPLDKIEQKLDACGGIEVTEGMLAAEGNISLADYRLMKRFDLDYLSLRDEDGDVAPRL